MAAEAAVLLVGLETSGPQLAVDQGEPSAPIYRYIPTMGTHRVLTGAKKCQVKHISYRA